MKIVKVENWETRNRLLDLIQIVYVTCSLIAQWAPAAVTPAPSVAGLFQYSAFGFFALFVANPFAELRLSWFGVFWSGDPANIRVDWRA